MILTGHGTGVFANLEKPVDIDTLIRIVKQTYDRVKTSRGDRT